MRYFAPIVLSVIVFVSSARADNLNCLLKMKGKSVKWDKDWQADLSDNDIVYRVDSISERQIPGEPPGYVLGLTAQGDAQKHQRTATIVKEIAARFFCSRIVVENDGGSKMRLPEKTWRDVSTEASHEVEAGYPSEEPKPEKLSFRRWIKNSWIPAVPEGNEAQFVCRIPGGPIACNKADFDLLNRDPSLSKMKKSTVWLSIPGPFIRHTQIGWVRDEPLGPYAESAVAECPLFGRTFYCLADDKAKFKSELLDLEREAAAAKQMNSAAKPAAKKPTK